MLEIKVEGMRCAHCTKAVTEAFQKENAEEININLETGMITWEGALDLEKAKSIINTLGFTVI